MMIWLYNLIWTNRVAGAIYLIVSSLIVVGVIAGSIACLMLNRRKKEKNQ